MTRLATIIVIATLACSPGRKRESDQPVTDDPSPAVEAPDRKTACGLKIAFIGDAGVDDNASAVLRLIRAEGAELVLHQGDLGYGEPRAWVELVDEVLGESFPYLISAGNHDLLDSPHGERAWVDVYQPFARQRIESIAGLTCTGILGGRPRDGAGSTRIACRYRGVLLVLLDNLWPDTPEYQARRRPILQFLDDQLASDDSAWRVCSWHLADPRVSLGETDVEIGLASYESCRRAGAIIATAHSHSYSRTRTLDQFEPMRVAPDWPERERVHVGPGTTFAFVSGLGGNGIDPIDCHPGVNDGCDAWASAHDADYGALFLELGCNRESGRGYFKTVGGAIVDEFTVTSGRASRSSL